MIIVSEVRDCTVHHSSEEESYEDGEPAACYRRGEQKTAGDGSGAGECRILRMSADVVVL